MIKSLLKNSYAKIREINKKYETPSIEMSRRVKFSLLILRLYLFTLIGLMVYKFIRLVK
jgi:hypothetical protein